MRGKISRFLLLVSLAPALAAGLGGDVPAGSEGWILEPFAAPASEVLEAARRIRAEEGQPVQVLLNESHYRFHEDGRVDVSFTLVYRLLTQAGVEQWGTAEAMWEPWHEKRPQIRARVIGTDGSERLLDPSVLTESPAQEGGAAVFDDRRLVHGPLPALSPGVVVEERESIEESSAKYPEGSIHVFYPRRGVPVFHARLVVDVPEGMPFRFKAELLGEVQPEKRRLEGATRWIFDFHRMAAEEDAESSMPPEVPRYARITFTTASSWQAVAARYASIVEQALSGSNLDEIAAQLVDRSAGRDEKIAAVFGFIRDRVRYTGLEFGQASIVPYSPRKVLERRYGDCKDQAVLAVGLLRRLGVSAEVALLDAAFGRDILPDFPGLGAFNHAIVHLPGNPERWLDTTDRYCAPGSLPLEDRGRLALIVDPATTGLVKIPEPRAQENTKEHVRTFRLADYGKAAVTVEIRSTGDFEDRLRSAYAQRSREESRKSLKEWVSSEFLADGLDAVDYSDPEDLSTPFVIRLKMKSAGRGITAIADAAVAIRLDPLLDELPGTLLEEPAADDDDKEGKREHDFVFFRPCVVRWIYRIVPPLGFAAGTLPDSRERHLGTVTLSERFAREDDGTVVAELTLDTGKRRITAEEVERTRDAVAKLLDEGPIMIQLQNRGLADLAAGHPREAVQELSAAARTAPDGAIHLARLARALLGAGLGGEARKVARRAVELEPVSLPANKTLAWVLQHDEIGRRFGKGWDREAALAAYRNALDLPDADRDLKLNYAILLEFDQRGLRYTTGPDLDRAAEVYRDLLEEEDNDTIRHNLYLTELHAGQAAAVAAERKRFGKNAKLDEVVAAAVAMTEGPAAAVELIDGAYASSDSRREVFRLTAVLLVQFREYAAAAVMARNAAGGAGNAAQLLGWAHNLERFRRFEKVRLDLTRPEGFAKEYLKRWWLEGDGSEDVRVLLSPRARKRVEVERKKASAPPEPPGEVFRRKNGLVPEIAVDTWLSLARSHVDGTSSGSRRVTLASQGPDGPLTFVVYLVRRGDTYRVLATEDSVELLGDEALDELAHGNVEGAREVLDWARERSRRVDSPDPFAGSAFPKLWTKGSKGAAPRVELAAAALVAQGPQPKRGIKVLERRLKEGLAGEQRLAAYQALADGYRTLGKYREVEAIAKDLLHENPDSRMLFIVRALMLVQEGKLAEAERFVRGRLKDTPDDLVGLRMLNLVAEARGELEIADRALGKILESPDADADDLNSRAWLALFLGRVDDEALGWAYSAVRQTQQGNHAYLHTLASLLAEADRPGDAYQVILQAIEQTPRREPGSADWFVFGRMAESYGFADAARSAYRRVEAPGKKYQKPTSTWELARRRLAALDTAQAGAAASGGASTGASGGAGGASGREAAAD